MLFQEISLQISDSKINQIFYLENILTRFLLRKHFKTIDKHIDTLFINSERNSKIFVEFFNFAV